MKTFRRGGIHPSGNKLTDERGIERLAAEGELRLLLSQSIGAPSKVLVKAGEHVSRGQKIAEAGGFVGAPIHSPAAGVVKKLDSVRNAQGLLQPAVIIAVDAEQPEESITPRSDEEIAALNGKELVEIIGDSGIVGLGGATFPTRVKLTPPEGKRAELLIINGAECEPYLTCDDRLMREHASDILDGTELLMRAAGVEECIVGIEENKPAAVEAMREACAGRAGIRIEVLKKKYPQGGEKQLIEAVSGREVPMGGLPIDVGCIVDNVATAYAVNRAVRYREPLMERVLTVTGPELGERGRNFIVPFGTPVEKLIELAGGLPETTGKVIAGGPMMGRAFSELNTPTTKGLSGILILPADASERQAMQPCIRCGRCVDACPMGLEPYLLMAYGQRGMTDEAKRRNVLGCIECGCCSYTCPSYRPILDYIRLTKIELRKNK